MSDINLTPGESEGYNLSTDERYLITNYITQYNQTNNQINHLYTVLEELRHNIATIYNNSRQLDNMRSSTINVGDNNTRNPRNNINMSINGSRSSYNLSDYINNLYREINMIIPISPVETSVTPLSHEEIAEFTLTQQFSSFENPINSECPIRLEEFLENDTVTQIKKCGHIFNSAELTNWFRNNVKCPVCRGDVIVTSPSGSSTSSVSGGTVPNTNTGSRTRQRFRTETRSDTRSNLYNFDNLFDFVFRSIDVSNNIIPRSNSTRQTNNSSHNNSNNGNNSLHENSSRY